MDYESNHSTNAGFTDSNLLPEDSAAGAAAGAGAGPSVAMTLQAGGDNVVVLPAGASLDDIVVRGRDLIVQMPDGQVFIIPDGAVFVPQIVVDGVTVPPFNLAALLIGNEPQPAAGSPQSSGGNFADPTAPLQAAYGLGDLLPYTELNFSQPQQEEVLPALVDRDPTVVIQDGGPIGTDVTDNVSEAGLASLRFTGALESAGSAAGNGSNVTTGTIFVTSPDGIAWQDSPCVITW